MNIDYNSLYSSIGDDYSGEMAKYNFIKTKKYKLSSTNQKTQFGINIFFRHRSLTNDSIIGISSELNSKIINFRNSMNGFPSYSSGNLGRMLYLSAITITTVGFGDIVPITETSRFFVGLEAVLGIIVIGLFLNAISNKIIDDRQQRQPPT